MSYINQNPNITKQVKEAAGLSELTGYPRQISEAIIPVIEVNKHYVHIVRSISTSGTTIYTIPANKDFYLTYASMCIIDTLAAMPTIEVTPEGGAQVAILTAMGGIADVTITAFPANIPTINFNPPILLKRNSLIVSGTESPDIGIYTIAGYLVDLVGD